MVSKKVNVDMTKKLIMRMYIGFVVAVVLLFGSGLMIINRQQDLIEKQREVIEHQEKTILQNTNTIESLRDRIDELIHKSDK